jgi:hypothetical protein
MDFIGFKDFSNELEFSAWKADKQSQPKTGTDGVAPCFLGVSPPE